MTRIKAAVAHAFGQPLSIEEVELAHPKSDEVEVTLDACAICHSDITYLDGGWGGSLPAVYGHEAAGRISALGDGVTGLKPGDPVVVTLIRSCGTCPSCCTGRPTGCETAYDGDKGPLSMPDGSKLHQAMASGAFAERVVVAQTQVVKIGDDIPMDVASLIACGVITGVGAVVNAAQMRPGQDAVIIGAGGVGLNAIQGARIAGALSLWICCPRSSTLPWNLAQPTECWPRAMRLGLKRNRHWAAARMRSLSLWGPPAPIPPLPITSPAAARSSWWACLPQAPPPPMRREILRRPLKP